MPKYYDTDDKPVSLWKLCDKEPQWAASRIETLNELCIEAHTRFIKYQMDVEDMPPEDHKVFMRKLEMNINNTD